MRKIVLLLLFIGVSPVFAVELSYSDCIQVADAAYENKQRSLTYDYHTTIKVLDMERSEQMRAGFTLFKLKASLAKIQEIRNNYKTKASLTESTLKKSINELQEEHDRAVESCKSEKKPMGEEQSYTSTERETGQ